MTLSHTSKYDQNSTRKHPSVKIFADTKHFLDLPINLLAVMSSCFIVDRPYNRNKTKIKELYKSCRTLAAYQDSVRFHS